VSATQGKRNAATISPHNVATDLGLRGSQGVMLLTWDSVLDLAAAAYWTRRRAPAARCGSEPGYRAHTGAPCQPCRRAHATVRAIRRRRASRTEAA